MNFNLTINLDSAAFQESKQELPIVLLRLAARLPGEPGPHDSGSIKDTNGNTVGAWTVTESARLFDTRPADPSDEIIAAMAANLDYVRYVAACEAENLEAHSLHMWDVHGRPKGPLGETLLQERSYEIEQGGF